MNIQEFLARRNVPFEVLEHRQTFDAQRMAEAVHVSGYHVGKTVMLRTDGPDHFVVAVIPASHHLDIDKAREAIGCEKVELATENEITQRCLDCEVGALPPFGSQYAMKTIIDETLANEDDIVFEGTTHTEAVKMNYDNFRKLEEPVVASLIQD
jgi:Ala-tRNA(Pro) deacylase